MKLLVGIIVTVALIISGGLYINQQLQLSSEHLLEQIELVSGAISQNDWAVAAGETDRLEQVWEQQSGWWPIYIEHSEMDNIEFSMAKFKEYVECQNTALALGQLSEIKLMIEHLPQKEEVSLDNIF